MASGSGSLAVVVGAGVGGLAAAAALSHHFPRVIVLERDALSPDTLLRPGVPQGRHVHGLLAGGLDALEGLLPGFRDDLLSAGAVPVRLSMDQRLELPGLDPFPQRDLGMSTVSLSRPLLERVLRQRVMRLPQVELRCGTRVTATMPTLDRESVAGVRVDSAEASIAADLVVDASGRGALTLEALKVMGMPAPAESGIEVDIRYTCAVFELPMQSDRGWKVLATRPDPAKTGRRAIMFPIEGPSRWLLGLGGVAGDSAPTDLPGYVEYAGTLRTPTACEAIRRGRLQGDIARFAFPRNLRRHFDGLRAFPPGLIPIGDAICRLNPAYGQGMSIAAQEASLLDRSLHQLRATGAPSSALAPLYFGQLGQVLSEPWDVALQDLAYPHLAEQRPADFRERMAFRAAISRLAVRNGAIHRLSTEVAQLLRPATVWQEPEWCDLIQREVDAAARPSAPA